MRQLAIAGFLIVGVIIERSAPAGGDDELRTIFGAWRKRQEATTSVRYMTKGEHVIAKGRYNAEKKPGMQQDLPPDDLRYEKKANWMIDFTKNWIRKEKEGQTFDFLKFQLRPFYGAYLYDGSTLIRYTPREKSQSEIVTPSDRQPDLEVQTDATHQFVVVAPDYPVFMAHGHVPTVKQSPTPKRLIVPIHEKDFMIHRKAVVEGRQCLVLKSSAATDAIDEYWVDQSRDSIIVRWARYEGKVVGQNMWAQIDISYERKESDWLPSSWKVTHYSASTGVVSTWESMQVISVEINTAFDVEEFRIRPSAGQVVKDLPANKLSRADSEGVLREFPLSTRAPKVATPESKGGVWYWFAATTLGLILVFGVDAWRRRLRARRK